MTEFFQKHRKSFIICGAIIAAAVFAFYLYALFRPGYWYLDVFLYKEKAPFEGMEVYSGHDAVNKAEYELTIAKDGMKTYMAFTVNEEERSYEIISDNTEDYYPNVTIFENGEQIFKGTHRGFGLLTEDDEYFEKSVEIIPSYAYPLSEEELFPPYNWLYDVSQSIKTEIRGEPYWLILIVMLIGLVALDMAHPDFFWCFNNWLDVKGGEPSEFYRFTQKALWILSPFIVLILMIVSFVPEMMF